MNRRKFIRVIGGISIISSIAPTYAFSNTTLSQDGILLEAATFANKGGWVLDTQFYQQMGGCFLLAHGMGKAVKNAMTTVEAKDAGQYYIHVRTRDWCPGNWESPGRFKVLVNGAPLKAIFGTEAGWAWQKGGKVTLKAGKNKVELQRFNWL